MPIDQDLPPPAKYRITFANPKLHAAGVWHHCGSYDRRQDAESAFEALIASDRAEAAENDVSLIGCHWKLAHERDGVILEVIADRVMTEDGLIDSPSRLARS